MEKLSTPPVFKNFAESFNAPNLSGQRNSVNVVSPAASVVISPTENDPQKDEVRLVKPRQIPQPLKKAGSVVLFLAAFCYGIPALRHTICKGVEPGFISVNDMSELPRRDFIKFSDQIEVKRNMTIDFVKRRISKVKELIRRNFFSYGQKTPEDLTPMNRMHIKFVSAAVNEAGEIIKFVKDLFRKIDIDYSNFKKS